MIRFMKLCTRWDGCSVNKCPLDVNEASMSTVSGDPERTCKEHPRHRLAVAAQARAEGVFVAGLHEGERERIAAGETVDMILTEADARLEARRATVVKNFGPKAE